MQDYHAEFVEIYNKNITRPGADRLLNWLDYHGCLPEAILRVSPLSRRVRVRPGHAQHQRLQCDDAAFFHRG